MSKKSGYLKGSNSVGLFLVTLFALCFAWYFINPVEQELHLAMFKLSYFGFEEMNWIGFIIGALQTYVWGYLAMALWQVVGCCHKGGDCCKE